MQNTLFTNDNLFILNGLNSEIADLIYLDPPFNSKRTYSAPIGSKSAGASFKDMWTWQDVNEAYLDKLIEKHPALVDFINSIEATHSKAMKAYITYITQRMIELHRVLKKTGSIYLHCDPTASHYLKQMMDCIFGKKQFMTEIVWAYSWGVRTTKRWNRKHDVILAYTKTQEYTFNADQVLEQRKLQEQSKRRLEYDGAMIKDHNKRGDSELALPTDVWHIPTINAMSKERTGYPTQKPLELLRKIIKASSKEGDLVLDPFCGCATTCVASEQLKRKWIGIDIEAKAVEVLIDRLEKDGHINDGLKFKEKGLDFIHRVDIPQRTDIPQILPTDKPMKERLYKEQSGKCKACDVAMRIVDFEVDHIIPKAKGGGDYYENYQLLCASCNRIKGARPMEYLRAKIITRQKYIKKIQFGE